ncbi:MAG: hypothetical protein JWO74_463 [Solirubrobacterales bacterium]|jgi:hypothetical protein|nr:hypothetical protein [Solirubrobacterales bacterium]
MAIRPLIAAATASLAVTGAAAPAAGAATYRSFGLTSSAPAGGVAGSTTSFRARVVLPTSWKRLSAPAGALRFREGHGNCFFTVTLSLRTRVGASGSPADHVAADLGVPAPAYLLDGGERPPGAWRVTRDATANPRITLHGEYARVAHADAGLIAGGQSAWAEIIASASSRPGDQCHSGTYRDTLGPALGDAFATARTMAYVRRA